MNRKFWCSTLLTFGFAAFSLTASAQRLDGTLRGTVEDPSGAVVHNATVTAINEVTGSTHSTQTTSVGEYVFPNLLPGMYTVQVQVPHFTKYIRQHVRVQPNQVVTADARLTIETVGAVIEVIDSGGDIVSTTSSQLSYDFDAHAVSDLPNPNNSGSPLNLALLAPNTTTQGAGVLGEGGSIGGARPRMNSFSIDGVDDNRLDITGHSQPVIADSIAEFNLITNQFAAEYGHSAGGQFNIITKSGGNAWHGSIFGYNQNRNYNSRDNLDKVAGLDKPSRFDYNRVGGDIGGPV